MARSGQRSKSKVAKLSDREARAGHRVAEATWVKKNKKRHQKAARDYYHKNKARIQAQRKVAKTSKHKAMISARRRRYGGGNRGRPREG